MIVVEPDERCLRGLAERLRLPFSASAASLVEVVKAVLGPQCLESVEQWGPRLVHRLVVQFRVEVRVGETDGVITVLHRQLSPPEFRRNVVEQLVRALSTPPHLGLPARTG